MRLFPAFPCRLYLILGLVVILTFQACARPPLVKHSTSPKTTEAIDSLLRNLTHMEENVTTLFYTGKLTSRERDSELEARVSIVGRRAPFEARIEFTHPWGAPLAHLVLNANRFKFLAFREKRLYVGSPGETDLRRYFPFLPAPAVIWGFIRGFPLILPYSKAISTERGTYDLLNPEGDLIQRLFVDLKTQRPTACFYPGIRTQLSFKDFEKKGNVYFARVVELSDKKRKRHMTLKIRQAIFNPTLPKAIFVLQRPQGFKLINLSDAGETPDPR